MKSKVSSCLYFIVAAVAALCSVSSHVEAAPVPAPDNTKWGPGFPFHVDSWNDEEPRVFNAVFSTIEEPDREAPDSRPAAPPAGVMTIAGGDVSKPASSE